MKIWRGSVLAAAAVSLFLAGCSKPPGGTAATSDVIKVGEFASLTGSEATFGQSSHKGTQLAIDELNAAGGVLGKKIQLLTEDNQSQAGQSATVVRKLISSDGVVAVLGEVASSRSLEAAPICQENKIPMISPSSTNPKVTEVGDYIFRVCFIDPFQGTVMANFARNTLKLQNRRGAVRREERLQPRPREIFQGRFRGRRRKNHRGTKITAAATRISTRN